MGCIPRSRGSHHDPGPRLPSPSLTRFIDVLLNNYAWSST